MALRIFFPVGKIVSSSLSSGFFLRVSIACGEREREREREKEGRGKEEERGGKEEEGEGDHKSIKGFLLPLCTWHSPQSKGTITDTLSYWYAQMWPKGTTTNTLYMIITLIRSDVAVFVIRIHSNDNHNYSPEKEQQELPQE